MKRVPRNDFSISCAESLNRLAPNHVRQTLKNLVVARRSQISVTRRSQSPCVLYLLPDCQAFGPASIDGGWVKILSA